MKKNCILVRTNGDVEKIYVDLSNRSEILNLLDCKRVNIIHTHGMANLTKVLGSYVSIVGYCDANGYYTNKNDNPIIQQISGYDTIIGDVLLCALNHENEDDDIPEPILNSLYSYINILKNI